MTSLRMSVRIWNGVEIHFPLMVVRLLKKFISGPEPSLRMKKWIPSADGCLKNLEVVQPRAKLGI
ncbi:hypothetical protein D3C76_1635000 [compost metagenome]